MKTPEFYNDTQLAGLLNLSLSRLRCKISAGDDLPPRIQPPGCKKRLWNKEKVHEWLEGHTVSRNKNATSIRKART